MPPNWEGSIRKQSSLPFQFQPVIAAHGVIDTLGVEAVRAGVGHLLTNAIGGVVPGSVPIGEH